MQQRGQHQKHTEQSDWGQSGLLGSPAPGSEQMLRPARPRSYPYSEGYPARARARVPGTCQKRAVQLPSAAAPIVDPLGRSLKRHVVISFRALAGKARSAKSVLALAGNRDVLACPLGLGTMACGVDAKGHEPVRPQALPYATFIISAARQCIGTAEGSPMGV